MMLPSRAARLELPSGVGAKTEALRQGFAQARRQDVPLALRVATWVTIVGHLFYMLPDYYLLAGEVGGIYLIRASVIALLLAHQLTLRLRPRASLWDGVVVLSIGSLSIIACALYIGRADCHYIYVLALVSLYYASFVPTTAPILGTCALSYVAVYALAAAGLQQTHPIAIFTSNIGLLVITAGIAVASVAIGERRDFRQFCLQESERSKALALAQANVQLEGNARQLHELSRAKADFFANVNHELRTPLAIVMAHLQCIEEKLDPTGETAIAAHASKGRIHALKLMRMVTDILELSRLDMKQVRLRLEELDLCHICQQLVDDVGPLAAKKGVTALFTPPAGAVDAQVLADAGQVDRLLINLMTNAIKFTPSGGRVTVGVATEADAVRITVADTGCGIAADALAKIFERGFQGHSTPDRQEGAFRVGLGIGLSLVEMIVRAHQGSIHAYSEPGLGTRFEVRLRRRPEIGADAIEQRSMAVPVEHEERRAQGPAELAMPLEGDLRLWAIEEVTQAQAQAPPPSSAPRSQPIVLIADDSVELTRLLGEILADYHIMVAHSGKEAMAKVAQYRPDLVITDVMMPDGTGIDLLKSMRQISLLSAIPVVMITASGSMRHQLEAGEHGIDGYIAKPFDARLVRATVDHLLAREREHAKEVVQARARALQLMARGLAHNVLNALHYISGSLMLSSQQIEDLAAALPSEQREHELAQSRQSFQAACEGVARAQEGIRAMQQMVDGKEEAPGRAEPVNDIVQRAVMTVGETAAMRLHLQATAWVAARRGQLEDVIINLVKNAQEAAGDGWRVDITTCEDVEGGGVKVVVKDHGPGFDAALAERIFDPDFSTKERGSGVGLSVSRQVVRDHGGQLSVDSAAGAGATFTLWLPVARETL